jgi:hypothetical protein
VGNVTDTTVHLFERRINEQLGKKISFDYRDVQKLGDAKTQIKNYDIVILLIGAPVVTQHNKMIKEACRQMNKELYVVLPNANQIINDVIVDTDMYYRAAMNHLKMAIVDYKQQMRMRCFMTALYDEKFDENELAACLTSNSKRNIALLYHLRKRSKTFNKFPNELMKPLSGMLVEQEMLTKYTT